MIEQIREKAWTLREAVAHSVSWSEKLGQDCGFVALLPEHPQWAHRILIDIWYALSNAQARITPWLAATIERVCERLIEEPCATYEDDDAHVYDFVVSVLGAARRYEILLHDWLPELDSPNGYTGWPGYIEAEREQIDYRTASRDPVSFGTAQKVHRQAELTVARLIVEACGEVYA